MNSQCRVWIVLLDRMRVLGCGVINAPCSIIINSNLLFFNQNNRLTVKDLKEIFYKKNQIEKTGAFSSEKELVLVNMINNFLKEFT